MGDAAEPGRAGAGAVAAVAALRCAGDFAPARRRSKEEYLEALAHLLERKRAYADAAETIRQCLVRDLEQYLALPTGTPIDVLAAQAVRRGSGQGTDGAADRLRSALDPRRPLADSESGFLRTLHEFEALRHDFLTASR